MAQNGFDHDWLIVGSGFGGSVSALRLSEKGYRVAVLECGRRYRDEDYAASTWDLRRFMWAPALGLRGILRLTPFKDVFIASGSAVGGGSVVYACTLYRGAPEFFVNPQWAGLEDWAAALKPHYDTAERMLGVNTVPFDSDGQTLLKQVAGHFGVEDTFRRTPVGIYFGAPGQQVADPYFGGSGPARTGCTRCGACMVGCRVGAKNTLVKNYLWFAEKAGAQVLPEHEVIDIRPLGAADGSDGYRVTTERPGAWFNKQRRSFTTRGVVVSAGALGTNRLLAKCKHGGSLPGISDRLGELVRTNSESILAVTLPDDKLNPANDVAISASIHPQPDTHIEFVTYGAKGDFMSTQFTMITGNGTRLTRPLRLLGSIVRHPLRFAKVLWPFGWGRRTVIFLVMQTLDNAIAFRAKRGWFGGIGLRTEQDPEKPNPTFIPVANEAAEWLAAHIAQSMVLEATANIPSTAHILGGAVIGKDAGSGVVDRHNRVFGYRNLLVCDGAAMPANPGVNPSLTTEQPTLPPTTFTVNQLNVGHAIDNFFNNGGALPPAFVSLFNLTGNNLTFALDHLSGEVATGAQTAAFQLGNQFLNLMLDPFVDGRCGVGRTDHPALGSRPECEIGRSQPAQAYASMYNKAPPAPAPVYEPRWTVWGSGYGGGNNTSGDPVVIGSHDLSARTAGFAGGFDYRLAPNSVVGFAIAGGGTNWSLSQGLGGGRSDAFQAGVYGATRWGAAYLAADFAFTNHWMSTDRFAFAGDRLTADFNAQSYGGRLESGYHFETPYVGVTPYAAIQAQSFHTPSYSETGTIPDGFALAFGSRDATDTRSELGARFDRALVVYPNAVLTLRGRVAWAHDWVSDPTLMPVFQSLPGASFIVNGAIPAADSALASAGAELRFVNGISLLAKFDGDFASHSSTYAGTGTIRYSW